MDKWVQWIFYVDRILIDTTVDLYTGKFQRTITTLSYILYKSYYVIQKLQKKPIVSWFSIYDYQKIENHQTTREIAFLYFVGRQLNFHIYVEYVEHVKERIRVVFS